MKSITYILSLNTEGFIKFSGSSGMEMNLFLTIDVEEWFQVENLKSIIYRSEWRTLESRVETNTLKLMEILEEYQCKATFFVLGWIAEKLPDLVREISSKGHEIASHGFDHEPLFNLDRERFRKDLVRSRESLEKCSQRKIIGFRAPTFSLTEWAPEILREEGFIYDSSYQPHRAPLHFRKLIEGSPHGDIPFLMEGLFEIPLSSYTIFGFPMPWSGGGYFRLIPYRIFKRGIEGNLKKNPSYCFYIHPWELDPEQPRINAPFVQRFKHYYALEKNEEKFRSLLNDFRWTPIAKALQRIMDDEGHHPRSR